MKSLIFIIIASLFAGCVNSSSNRPEEEKTVPQWQYGFGLRNLTNKMIVVKPFKVYPNSLPLGGKYYPFINKTITPLPSLVRPNKKIVIEWESGKPPKKFRKEIKVILPDIVRKNPEILSMIYFNIDMKNCFCSYEIVHDRKKMTDYEILQDGTVFNYMQVMKKNGFTSWKEAREKFKDEDNDQKKMFGK